MRQSIKLFSIATVFLISAHFTEAQNDKAKRPSPPAQVTQSVNGANITIDYSQPSKKGRKVYGELVPYGKVWRTGANETTWIEVSKDVKVQGKTLKAGKYGLHTIPGEKEWTIIFNSAWKEWGSYNYKEADDVLRVTAKPMAGNETEKFTIDISNKGVVSMAWDKTKVEFTIQ